MKQRSLAPALRNLAFAALLLASALFAPTAYAEKYASIVIDMDTHEVLHARNADEPRYPASLTKVMTLYMLFDALEAACGCAQTHQSRSAMRSVRWSPSPPMTSPLSSPNASVARKPVSPSS